MSRTRNCFILGFVFLLSLTALDLSQGQTQLKQKSRLIVSFYSICCGTDREAQEKLDRFISDYERAWRRKLTNAKVHWGKEGEIDYCLGLANLTRKEQRRFVGKVRSLLHRSKLVHISENATCKQER